jgi:hypothetical protein
LLIKQHTETVIYRPLLIFKREPSTPSLWAVFLATWLTCANRFSRILSVPPIYRAVSTHCICSPQSGPIWASVCVSQSQQRAPRCCLRRW